MLAQGQLTNSPQPLLILDTFEEFQVRSVILFNTGENTNEIYLYAVPNDNGSLGVVGSEHKFLKIQLKSGQIFEFTTAHPITYENQNDAIFGEAQPNSNEINYFIGGVLN